MANHFMFTLPLVFFIFCVLQCAEVITSASFSSKQQVIRMLCRDYELSALFQFKESFSIDSRASAYTGAHPKTDSWKLHASSDSNGTYKDCCLWDGVECSQATGHVIGLHLSSSFLYGPLNSSSSLFRLVHLQSLDLSDNDFVHSLIPSRISHFLHLTSLDLSYSVFSGQIPKEISELTQLASLNLSRNPLKLHSRPSFGDLVQNLTRLEKLSLSHVDISSQVPSILANISSLRWIALINCRLSGEFPMAIFHLPKLKILGVALNQNLSGYLPEFHESNRSVLEDLSLGYSGFFGQLPVSIGHLMTLNKLDLQSCSFSGFLPASLNNLTELTILYLNNNGFRGEIPSLASLSRLTTLDLRNNGFTGHIPSLSNLTQLTEIHLRSNHIAGRIQSWLMNMTHLTEIDFAKNLLQGPIPTTFSQLKDLTVLDLFGNNLSGIVGADIFLNLKKLKRLQLGTNRITFAVSYNHSTNANLPQLEILGLIACNLKAFPDFLRSQKELVVLYLDGNQIEGQIPEWFWNTSRKALESVSLTNNLLTGFEQQPLFVPWSGVRVLDLAYNMLQGSLPLPPPSTSIYRVADNKLTGEIHPLICNLSSLYELDLSNNNMTGTIPPCLSNLSNYSLSILMLEGNKFLGTIPNNFMKGSKLIMIDLSENRLVGQLPRSLAYCTMLRFLDLADNSLDDVFPSWLGTLSELQVMILGSNKLHGAIERSPVKENSNQFQKLRIIDLSHNGFSGYLPEEYIKSWVAMKISTSSTNAPYLQANSERYGHGFSIEFFNEYDFSMTITNKGVKREYARVWSVFTVVDLSSNKFIGAIPGCIGQLQGLQLLNLSNNHLAGSIPPSLENLRNLESLDLSLNMLSGRIPQQLANLGFLAFLNVSYNNLVGPIPEGKQFNTYQYNSYEGNVGLCGEPLSKTCGYTPAPSIINNNDRGGDDDDDSDFPNRVDWIVISFGYGSGLVVGILIIGKYLTARHHEWFVEKFGKRQDKWVRPLRGGRRN